MANDDVRDEVRQALKKSAKGLTARKLLDVCDSCGDLNEMVKVIHQLKSEGKIKADGMMDSQVLYKVADWPEKGYETVGAQTNKATPPPPPEAVVEATLVVEKPRAIDRLQDGLFAMLDDLNAGAVDTDKAKTYAALAMTLIKSMEVQLEFARITGGVPALEDKR